MFKLVIFLALVTLVYSKPVNPDDLANSCMRQNDIWGETRYSLTGRLMRGETITANEQCYFKCFSQKAQMIDEDGNFTPREGIIYVSAQIGVNLSESEITRAENNMSHCSFSHIEDRCERGMNIMKCFMNAI